MRIYLFIILIFTSNFTFGKDLCSQYKGDNYLAINKSEINLKHYLYSEISGLDQLVGTDYSEDIIRKITSSSHPMFMVKTNCVDDFHIFFSVYIGKTKVEFMEGVILIESARYFSGPHSLLIPDDDKIIIIQADNKKKPNKPLKQDF